MKKTNIQSHTEKVTEYLNKLDPHFRKTIETLRQIILTSNAEIGEQVKWNSPSFFYTGEMKPFNPKEYKRDIVVINLHKGNIILVFPTGAKIKDTSGLLEGDYTDGRRIVKFKDLKDVNANAKALQTIIKSWIALIEK